MLNLLHIENVAVIEKIDICFSKGFNVLTGETGTGKSIIIDAIGCICGNKVSKDIIRRGASYSLISGVFDTSDIPTDILEKFDISSDEDLIIQRKISIDGKNSCKINGIPITIGELRSLSSGLIDIHGQNDGLKLLDEKLHLYYLDQYGDYSTLINEYSSLFDDYSSLLKEFNKYNLDKDELRMKIEALEFSTEEIRKIRLKPGEYDELLRRRDLLRNSEKLTDFLGEAVSLIEGTGSSSLISSVDDVSFLLQKASQYSDDFTQVVERMNDISFQLTDVLENIKDFLASLDFSPEEYDKLENRISLLNKIFRKYNRDENALIAYLSECDEQLAHLSSLDENKESLSSEIEAKRLECLEVSKLLTAARCSAALTLEKDISNELTYLNMPNARFKIEISSLKEEKLNKTGKDEVRFLISANKGENLGRISKIASGGELSRIMLAMKNVFSHNDPIPTVIFDEIDTGVSGIAAQKVAEKLYSVSKSKQVMCVTHLPQIAAMADTQFSISKEETDERTVTSVALLDIDGRINELARLYGGDNITELTLASAADQLKKAEHFKSQN